MGWKFQLLGNLHIKPSKGGNWFFFRFVNRNVPDTFPVLADNQNLKIEIRATYNKIPNTIRFLIKSLAYTVHFEQYVTDIRLMKLSKFDSTIYVPTHS